MIQLKINWTIDRKSPFSNKSNTMTFKVYPNDIERYREGKELIQDCFPYLTPDEREFILTGITKEEWNRLFSDENTDN